MARNGGQLGPGLGFGRGRDHGYQLICRGWLCMSMIISFVAKVIWPSNLQRTGDRRSWIARGFFFGHKNWITVGHGKQLEDELEM